MANMEGTQLEKKINDIETYIDGCKSYPLSNNKIVCNRDELTEFVAELRLRLPSEIKKYRKILQSKDEIINDAKQRANEIINAAQVKHDELINEHEIRQRAITTANELIEQAQATAQNIVDQATIDANNIRTGSIQYTDDMLADLQKIIQHSLDDNQNKYNQLMDSLNKALTIVVNNRNELRPDETPQPQVEETANEPEIPGQGFDSSDAYEAETVDIDKSVFED